MVRNLFFMLVAASLIMFSGGAKAIEMGPWKLLYHTHEQTFTVEEFTALQGKYSALLGSVALKDLDSGYVSINKMKFIGQSVCQADDPRLLFVSMTYGYCHRTGDAKNPLKCFNAQVETPGFSDPCAQ